MPAPSAPPGEAGSEVAAAMFAAPLPPAAPEDAPLVVAADALAILPVVAPRAAGEVFYPSPNVFKRLIPGLPRYALMLDSRACRFRGKANREVLPSIGFGPRTGRSRRRALQLMLDVIWTEAGVPQPEGKTIDAIPTADWGDLLDDRVEAPFETRR